MSQRANRRCAPGFPGRRPSWVLVLLVIAAHTLSLTARAGDLSTLRTDVRAKRSPAAASSSSERSHSDPYHCHDDDDNFFGELFGELFGEVFLAGALVTGVVVTTPVWGPHHLVGDDFEAPGFFPRFPYDDTPGFMMIDRAQGDFCWPAEPRDWSGRFRAEYGDNFGDLTQIGAHLLVESSSRWGLDTEFNFREEDLLGGAHDQLWTGDCNLVFRFAQHERLQMRIGAGFNWLADDVDSNYGYNVTYGGDWFPCDPWVISSNIDWGEIGSADLFHFRITGGVVVYGIEVYTGYDYYDVDRVQISSYIAGVRVWF